MVTPRALRRHPSRGRPRDRWAARAATVGVAVLALAGAFVPPAPADAARPAKRCPKVGRTLAVERFDARVTSRVWRSRGVTSGCTILRNGRARTMVLTRVPTGSVELDDDTVAWTTPGLKGGAAADRVSLVDLQYGSRTLRAVPAVPSAGPGVPRRSGSVDALRVYASGFVAWIADGTTVVVGADPDGFLQQTLPEGPAPEIPHDGPLAVAATYPADPAVADRLRTSLTIAAVPGDPGDADDCAYSYATAFRWETAPGQAFEAQMRGTRGTPDLCRGR
jgi:hypothetical protein